MTQHDRDFDLAVVGAGPAGAACALRAARAGLHVALLEPQRGTIDKPCGEGVMPSGIDVLDALDLGDVVARGRAFPGLRFVIPGTDALEVALPRPGVAIERFALQEALDLAISAESKIMRIAQHVETARDADGFRVRARSGEWRSRALVACDGLTGHAVDWLRARTTPSSTRIGVRARFTVREPLDRVEVHCGDACEVYLTPLANDVINAVVLVDGANARIGGAQATLDVILSRHPAARARLGALVTEPALRALPAPRPRHLALKRAFLAGDAGGGVDPILGCGVTIALETGLLAADCVARIQAGDTSGAPEREYARAYAHHVRARRALAAFLRAFSRHPSFARATAALTRLSPRLRDALVGVAAGTPRGAPNVTRPSSRRIARAESCPARSSPASRGSS